MKMKDFSDISVSDLLKGYVLNEEGEYSCIECEKAFSDEKAMLLHWEENHSRNEEERFVRLLNADSIMGFSFLEKMVYYRMFQGKKNNEIAVELSIPISTVKTLRRNLVTLYTKSKAIILLGEMLFGGNSIKRKYIKSEQSTEEIPGLDSKNGKVTGFYSKSILHDEKHPIWHATVLILVAKRNEKKQWSFLITNKSIKNLTISGNTNKLYFPMFDFLGGHTEWVDYECNNSEICIGEPIPAEVYKAAAARELLEELRIKNFQLNPSDLIEFLTLEYDGATYPIGWNLENSILYLYVLPDNIKDRDVLVRDVWVDTLGEVVKNTFSIKFEPLQVLINEDDSMFMDGAKRFLDYMKKDGNEKEEQRMFNMLNKKLEELKK